MTDASVIENGTAPGQTVVRDRRRPGRLVNPSPELIALMRQPTDEARRKVALYDAPNFTPPSPDRVELSVVQFLRFGSAFGMCAAGWVLVLKLMMMAWG